MSVGSPTAGTWFSSQWRPDNEFETDTSRQLGDGAARGLRLRHDHGANSLADDFQQEIAFFGIERSRARIMSI